MATYRKKPIVVEAVQWDGKADTATSFLGAQYRIDWWYAGTAIIIPTLEGEMRGEVGDWIIQGIKGEFYLCKPDIFDATYELVEQL